MNTNKQPALFISHGSPMLAMEDSETSRFLKQLGERLERPKAIIVFSAHLDVPYDIVITAGEKPSLIYDFYGFPEPLYKLEYPAPGNPDLATKVAELLSSAGVYATLDTQLGWDHGVWMPLLLMFPHADIPVVQVSINSRLGAELNYKLGQLLAPLRDEGVLLLGSGGISHNLREVFNATPDQGSRNKVDSFTSWVNEKLLSGNIDSLLNYLKEAPHVFYNHPTQEHFIPLFNAMGSSNLSEVTRLHNAVQYEVL